MAEEGEVWKDVDGFPYIVSSNGRVARILAPRVNANGYPRVTLCKPDGTRSDYLTHRLVLEVFVGKCPEGMEACHFPDNNPANCRLDNLRWDAPSKNNLDKRMCGTSNQGEDHPLSKLKEDDVRAIIALRSKGAKLKDIAEEFSISQSYVGQLARRWHWKHLENI